MAVFHQRFSTNTLPQWRLAHPYRYLAHNGEINTIQGNRNWATARGPLLRSPLLPQLQEVLPLVSLSGSDSQSLDNMLEVLLMGGLDPLHAMRLLMPPAWHGLDAIDPDLRAFYEYYSVHMEPWDGPAGVVLTDGRYALCTLDRNGLRPARFCITQQPLPHDRLRDRRVGLPARGRGEEGQARPRRHDRARPQDRHAASSADIDQLLKTRHPYKSWLKKGVRYLESDLVDPRLAAEPMDRGTLSLYQKMFNVTQEERDDIIRVLAQDENEAVGSMGDDTPMPVLSHQVRSLYDYFRQQFAQVTNPPIDPLRETHRDVAADADRPGVQHLRAGPRARPPGGARLADPLAAQAAPDPRHRGGHARVHRPAVRAGGRAEERDPAHVRAGGERGARGQAGAAAVGSLPGEGPHPRARAARDRRRPPAPGDERAALQVQPAGRDRHRARAAPFRLPDRLRGDRGVPVHGVPGAVRDDAQRAASSSTSPRASSSDAATAPGLRKGLFKIMSKMGISTISSYRSSQLFEIVGLADEVVQLCFTGTESRVQGADFADLEADLQALAAAAWNPREPIGQGGLLKYVHGGEYHMYNPDVIAALQAAVISGDYGALPPVRAAGELAARRPRSATCWR